MERSSMPDGTDGAAVPHERRRDDDRLSELASLIEAVFRVQGAVSRELAAAVYGATA